MSSICKELHIALRSLPRHKFPFDVKKIPQNGIYILFEKGELAHGGDRVVRVGTHTGKDQLRSRLKQHFITENKDRSIFRKNIGRALLHEQGDSFLEQWNWDLTTRESKDRLLPLLDTDKQKQIEKEVTSYIQGHFSFSVFDIPTKEDRLNLESKIISTVSLCQECKPSEGWLGSSSPVQKIRESGLWLVQGLYKTPLNEDDSAKIENLIC